MNTAAVTNVQKPSGVPYFSNCCVRACVSHVEVGRSMPLTLSIVQWKLKSMYREVSCGSIVAQISSDFDFVLAAS